MEASAPATMAIEAAEVAKAFGAVNALAGASFSAAPGEIHALVGENGAGKSTLIKILTGLVQPDRGVIRVHGEVVRMDGLAVARRLGIGTVFQELSLLPDMTVAENLLLRREPRNRVGLISRRKALWQAGEELDRLEIFDVAPHAVVGTLTLEQQQRLEIAKVVARDPKILLLDEPTSALSEGPVDWLFKLMRRLRQDGTTIVFTSHRWNEIVAVSDRMTIFRNGCDVGRSHARAVDERRAIELMTGRQVEALFPTLPPLGTPKPMMEVRELTSGKARGVSFTLRRGEILGVGGLAGQGQLDLFLAIFGARRRQGGDIIIGDKRVSLRTPRDAVAHGVGIAFVPEDRKREGLILPMSVRDNMTLPILHRLSTLGYVDRKREDEASGSMIERLGIRTSGGKQPVSTLSGGNQQKVLLGRWLLADAQIMLLYDVTRGVDIATKHDIYQLMARLSMEGRAMLFYSSDTEEMAHLCHGVLVMRDGRITRELRGKSISSDALVRAALHVGDASDNEGSAPEMVEPVRSSGSR